MIVGIDNGISGGIVAISRATGSIIDKTPMPLLHRLGKKETDTRKVYDWITDLNTPFTLAIEEPLRHARSSQAIRSMAINFGKILGLAESKQWDIKCVSVHKWQKRMLGRVPKGKTKEHALAVAYDIAPDECWKKSKRASKPHDGMVDAFLIARYIWDKPPKI